MATLSDGTKVYGPKPRKKLMDRMRRLSRSFSRKQKGSKNRDKARKKLARLHARRRVASAHIRKDALHKLTTYVAVWLERLPIAPARAGHVSLSAAFGAGPFIETSLHLSPGQKGWTKPRVFLQPPRTMLSGTPASVRDHFECTLLPFF